MWDIITLIIDILTFRNPVKLLKGEFDEPIQKEKIDPCRPADKKIQPEEISTPHK